MTWARFGHLEGIFPKNRFGVFYSNHFTKFFGVVYLFNILITLIPIGIIEFNPFQNIFNIDSKSYFCEAWRRAGISIQEQNLALEQITRVYGGASLTCDSLIRSYYPGAPIFSRLLFLTPIQLFSLIHLVWGPIFLHFTFLAVFFMFVLKVLKSANFTVQVAILLFFSNPSLVYPIFAFATEKYQLLVITYVFILINSEKDGKTSRSKFYIAIASLMLLRENLVWGLFFCLYLHFIKSRRPTSLKILPTAILSVGFSIFQIMFSKFNTPKYVTSSGGFRDFTEFEALERVLSSEAFSLLDKSFFADIRVLLANFTILDLFTILSLSIVVLEFIRRSAIALPLLGLFLLGLGLAMDMFSAAYFKDFTVVTFFRLLLPSYWAILVMLSLNKSRVFLE